MEELLEFYFYFFHCGKYTIISAKLTYHHSGRHGQKLPLETSVGTVTLATAIAHGV
jgi:hypothetical protein